jgi:two-component system chemotaxis response regulator CheY
VLRQFASKFAPNKLCLIADSSLAIRKAAASIVSELRFQVTEAASGREALTKCRQRSPDAILLDGALAEEDGFAFLRALMRKTTAGQPKIILCTTDRDPARIARAIGAGADEYLVKPFDRTILTAKFEKLGLTAQ